MVVSGPGGGLLGGRTTHMPAYRQSSKVAGQRLVYSNRCGRVMLKNVIVQNQGVDWDHEGNIYWQHKVCQNGYGQPCLAPCQPLTPPPFPSPPALSVCAVYRLAILDITVF